MALWAVVTVWIIIDPLTGSHSDATSRGLRDVTFALVAVACAGLTTWLIQHFVAAPRHTVDRAFELGYLAGCADAHEGPAGQIGT